MTSVVRGRTAASWPRRRVDWVAVALVTMTGLATLATLYRFFEFIAWA